MRIVRTIAVDLQVRVTLRSALARSPVPLPHLSPRPATAALMCCATRVRSHAQHPKDDTDVDATKGGHGRKNALLRFFYGDHVNRSRPDFWHQWLKSGIVLWQVHAPRRAAPPACALRCRMP